MAQLSLQVWMWITITALTLFNKGINGHNNQTAVKGPILFVADHEVDTTSRLLYYQGSGSELYADVTALGSDGNTPLDVLFAANENSENTALSFDYDESLLIWSDPGHRAIYLGDMAENTIQQVFVGTSSVVHGVAVDWLANNIYWTDAAYNWIKMSTYDGSYVRTLVTTGLDIPAGIACDPVNGHLYWSDWGDHYKIERSTLSGEDRTILVDDNRVGVEAIGRPVALAIDYARNTLYWTDSLGHKVNSLDLTVEDATPVTFASVQHDVGDFFSLDIDPEFGIFVGDRLNEDILLFPFDGGLHTSHHIYKPNAVLYYDRSRQASVHSPCETAPCEQLCTTDRAGFTCLCGSGYQLADDQINCNPDTSAIHDHELVFSAEDDKLCKMPANIAHKPLPQRFNVSCFTDLTMNAIDFDVWGNYIYAHTNINLQNSIMRVRLREGESWSIIVDSTDARGVAVDWIESNVYWTDRRKESIMVAKLDGTKVTNILPIMPGVEPSGIAIHAVKRFLFWSVLGRYPGIERSSLSGAGRKKIVTMDYGSEPRHLAIDFTKNRLYWADDGIHSIKSVDFDGNDLQTFASFEPTPQFTGITIFQDFLFLAEGEEKQIIIYDITNARRLKIITLDHIPTAIKFFHKSLQPLSVEPNPCDGSVCRSDHICINTDYGAECLCPERQDRCMPLRRCPLLIPNGRMEDSCDNVNGRRCSVICNAGFLPVSSDILCRDDGLWSEKIICQHISCPLSIPNVYFDKTCTALFGSSCRYMCGRGYQALTTEILTCNEMGQWSKDPQTLCQPELVTQKMTTTDTVTIKPNPTGKAEKVSGADNNRSKLIILILAVGIGTLALVVVFIVIFIFLRRKRKRSNQTPADTQQIVNSPNDHVHFDGGAVIGIPNPLYASPTDYDYNACSPPEYTPSPPPHYEVPVDAPAMPEKAPLPETVHLEAASDTARYLNSPPGATAAPSDDHTYESLHQDTNKEGFEKAETLAVELKGEADA